MYILHFVYLPLDEHLDCFYLLAIVNNAVMNIGVQISVPVSALNSSGYILRSGMTGTVRE